MSVLTIRVDRACWIDQCCLTPALRLLPAAMDTPQARVLLLAYGLQESELRERRQLVGNPPRPTGPAKGLWQFELGGGCKGVVTHPTSRFWMAQVCERLEVEFNARSIWNSIEHDDVLAAAAARLLIFTDPKTLPARGDIEGAWKLYMRTWRPGKPKRDKFDGCYSAATTTIFDI